MNFVGQQNAYYITVESQVSINFILVQCDANVQLMDVERNLAILSIVKPEKVCILRTSHFFFVQEKFDSVKWDDVFPLLERAVSTNGNFPMPIQHHTTGIEPHLRREEYQRPGAIVRFTQHPGATLGFFKVISSGLPV